SAVSRTPPRPTAATRRPPSAGPSSRRSRPGAPSSNRGADGSGRTSPVAAGWNNVRPMPTPDYDVHRNHKERMQRRVVRTLFAVAFLYFAFLAPDELAQVALRAVASHASWTGRLLSIALGTPTLAWTVSFLLFASDSAFKGANGTARWLRRQFAAN